MAKTNAHDWNLGRFHQLAEMIDGFLAMSRITRTVADEDAIEMMSYFVDRVVVREGCNACASADQAAKDI